MNLQIEKNVPIPPESKGRPARLNYDEIDIGDSVKVSTVTDLNTLVQCMRRRGMKATQRKIKDGRTSDGFYWRIWRVK